MNQSSYFRLVGSFFGFDLEVSGSSKVTVLTRQDPFPRMLVSMDTSAIPSPWTETLSFYAFTIPLPSTTRYIVKTSVPDSTSAMSESRSHSSRHKLTTVSFETSWDFIMEVHVYPASPNDCLDVISPESMCS